MLMAPIFHVHGENPEAMVHVIKLAADYRMQFSKDVVIDVVCYRRYGHNEGDEPYYTQPQMYERIKNRPPVHRIYSEKLFEEGVATNDYTDRIQQEMGRRLEESLRNAREKPCHALDIRFFEGWEGRYGAYSHALVETGVQENLLVTLAEKLNALPEGFSVHPRLQRILDRRVEAVRKGEGIDWATAEMLSFASLLVEKAPVRLSGQDSRRGTFSQRHSVLVDINTGRRFIPINSISDDQAPFTVYDSMLSEFAVLGFEYGYSLAEPSGLTIWEAQFGDFANNAQTIIDEYISSAETKWLRKSGLVMLLPHGYEGQGPDHSSARIERYLGLCAEDNIQVCHPSSPAQYFHLLRRQVKSSYRKPLVVFTPKSLLRSPLAVSKLSDLTSGYFQEILHDETGVKNPKRVLLCSGKIYYDLFEKRRELQAFDIAIVRIEQLYPFAEDRINEVISKYGPDKEWHWVQEEPENMGAWPFMHCKLEKLFGRSIGYIGRAAAASPATGFSKVHKEEQAAIVEKAVRVPD
jgi:2-oxoglutarate dehydrogenase E1 component